MCGRGYIAIDVVYLVFETHPFGPCSGMPVLSNMRDDEWRLVMEGGAVVH
jgi:hypothetical protein